jgi:hypothetical protein
MTIQYSLLLLILMHSTFSFGQTKEDIDQLGLSDSQLHVSFEQRQIQLTNKNTGKRKKIKEGAFATIKLLGDTTALEVILEAFLKDSIIVSSLKPKLVDNQIQLIFTEFRLIPIDKIDVLQYSVRHKNGTYWGGFLMTLTGMEAVILPLIMPLILGNVDEMYSKPQFPYIVIGGAIIYVVGRKMQKSLKSKDYDFSEWNYEVIKK